MSAVARLRGGCRSQAARAFQLPRLSPLCARLAGCPSRATAQKRQVIAYSNQQDEKAGAEEELPPWVRREKERELQANAPRSLPWPLYLVGSILVTIAAVGSVFEFLYKNPVFGVIQPDNVLWAPILGLFAFTGLPTAGFLFFKGVSIANAEAERQDKLDGYIK